MAFRPHDIDIKLDLVDNCWIRMTVITKAIKINSKGENDMVDITDQTLKAIQESKLKDGIVTVFVSGSTGAITTIEYEPGLRNDFPKMLNRIYHRI